MNKNIGLQQKSTLFSYPTHLWYMEISWKEMLLGEKWKIYHSLAGEGAPKEGKKEKGASSSTASECCQLVLELECILSASTNILQQSLFVWMFFSSTEDTFVAPLCTWWGVLGQGPAMLHKGFGQLMFMNQHSFQKL